MESSSLDAVLSGQVEQPQVTETPQAQEVVQETVEQQPQETTGEQTGTPPEAKQDDPIEKHRKGLEAAAAAERKRRQEAEQRAQALEQELRSLRQPQQTQQPPQETGDPKPKREQFASEDEWLDARDEWRDRQRAREWQQAEKEREELARREKTESALVEASKLPGFDFQAFQRLPVSNEMADAILDSDVAPQLVHFLTANPQEARRIYELPKPRQIKELARIEDRLSAPPKAEPKPEQTRLPETLTQARDARGRFDSKAYDGPTPLNAILK
jgi:hypothetical protein